MPTCAPHTNRPSELFERKKRIPGEIAILPLEPFIVQKSLFRPSRLLFLYETDTAACVPQSEESRNPPYAEADLKLQSRPS